MSGSLAFLGVVVLAFVCFGLRRQVKTLEGRIARLQSAIDGLSDRPVPQAPETLPEMPAGALNDPERPGAVAAENPWIAARAAAATAPLPPSRQPMPDRHPRAFVFRSEAVSGAMGWLRANWFLAIAALSMALAGVFLVQYGVEHGVVTPFWRVVSAAALGIALIWFGEVVRRRGGDQGRSATAYLPSTFSGAGLVALFAAVLSAHHLYGLIGPGGAFVWLMAVAIVAVLLGWVYGPFLTVVGLSGSAAAPFLVGGDAGSAHLLYYYFALIAAAGLAIDAWRRWAWVSTFALILTYGASWMLFQGGAGDLHYLGFALIAVALAVTVPPLSLKPLHDGPTVLGTIAASLRHDAAGIAWPAFPTRIAAAAFAASAAAAMSVADRDAGAAEVWLALCVLAFLFVAATVWFRDAPALDDLALIPPVLFFLLIWDQAWSYGTFFQAFTDARHLQPEAAPPVEVTLLVAMALCGSALAHWRGLFPGVRAFAWSAGAALLAPITLILLELFWTPSTMLGAGWWAAHAMTVAAIMVLFARQTAARDGQDRRRTALYALSALTMISMSLILVLSSTALTLALAGMVLGAAVIDHRLDMRPVTMLVHAGAAVIAWRLIVDPGLAWADDAPLWEVLLAYLGSAGLMAAAALQFRGRNRLDVATTAESAGWVALALLGNVLIQRFAGPEATRHATIGLHGLVWLVSMTSQFYRMKGGGWLNWVRIVLAIVFALVALVFYALGVTLANPLDFGNPVEGPPIFDSLLVAYLLPALPLSLIALRFTHLRHWLRALAGGLAALFAALYVTLEIRRFWHGRDLSAPGVLEGELYTYTVALLLASAALLFVAFWRRSHLLRRIAIAGITLTVAKVFLVDMAGLAGLYRVASFLGLGLSLAGLAWIVRKMTVQWDAQTLAK